MMGRKILNGEFNLTKISFPIKCMSPESTLISLTKFQSSLPVYLAAANASEDPLERMKLTMAANFCWYFYEYAFDKPLNPILGETYQAFGADGARIYAEQTSHHPPISHFIVDGPNDIYKVTGYL